MILQYLSKSTVMKHLLDHSLTTDTHAMDNCSSPALLEEADREDGRLGDGLLQSKRGDGEHGDAAVGDLGVAHRRRVGAERVEAEHTGQVVVLLAELLVEALRLPVHSKANNSTPVDAVHLAEAAVQQRGRAPIAVEEVAEVEDLRQRPATNGHHNVSTPSTQEDGSAATERPQQHTGELAGGCGTRVFDGGVAHQPKAASIARRACLTSASRNHASFSGVSAIWSGSKLTSPASVPSPTIMVWILGSGGGGGASVSATASCMRTAARDCGSTVIGANEKVATLSESDMSACVDRGVDSARFMDKSQPLPVDVARSDLLLISSRCPTSCT